MVFVLIGTNTTLGKHMVQGVLLVYQMICTLPEITGLYIALFVCFSYYALISMLYELSGTENYLCTDLDGEVWLTAKLLYASKPPPFYTRDCKESCDAEVLSRFGLRQFDITLDNADDIYLHLVS